MRAACCTAPSAGRLIAHHVWTERPRSHDLRDAARISLPRQTGEAGALPRAAMRVQPAGRGPRQRRFNIASRDRAVFATVYVCYPAIAQRRPQRAFATDEAIRHRRDRGSALRGCATVAGRRRADGDGRADRLSELSAAVSPAAPRFIKAGRWIVKLTRLAAARGVARADVEEAMAALLDRAAVRRRDPGRAPRPSSRVGIACAVLDVRTDAARPVDRPMPAGMPRRDAMIGCFDGAGWRRNRIARPADCEPLAAAAIRIALVAAARRAYRRSSVTDPARRAWRPGTRRLSRLPALVGSP